MHRSVDAGVFSSHNRKRSIQDRHTASPAPAVFAGSDQACMSVDSRDKMGVLHTTSFACPLALRIGK